MEVGDFIYYKNCQNGSAVYIVSEMDVINNKKAFFVVRRYIGSPQFWIESGLESTKREGDKWTKISKEEAEVMKIMEE